MSNLVKEFTKTLFLVALIFGVDLSFTPPCFCTDEAPPKIINVDDPKGRLLFSGAHAWNSGKKREAVRCFTKLLEMDPTYHLALIDRAMAYFELKNYRKAMRDLQLAEKCEPTEPNLSTVKVWRAYFYMRQGKFEKASKLLDDALQAYLDIPSYYFARGVIAQKQNDFSAAQKNYDLALGQLDKTPKEEMDIRAAVLFNKSICLRQLNQAKDASTVLKLACTISPKLAHRKQMYRAPLEPLYMLDFTGFEEKFGFPDQNEIYRTVY